MGAKEKADDSSTSVLFETWTLMHSVGELLERALAGASLNPDEFGFYSAVYDHQPVTPNTIAELAGMPATTVSSYLNRLLARGDISKVRNPADGRSFLVELTPQGNRALHETWLRFEPAQDAVVASLTLPVDQVIETMRRLTEAAQTAAQAMAQGESRVVRD
jgi:DNA-binding MarR family transcriptional regulator